MIRNNLSPRAGRRRIPPYFMLKVEPEEMHLLRSHVKAVFGDNSGESDSSRVEYLGDCVLTDREEALLKDLLIRINRRFIAVAGRRSGIAEFWGEGNRGSSSQWVLLPDKQKERPNGHGFVREAPSEGHLRVDVSRSGRNRQRGVVFDLGRIFAVWVG